MTDAFAMLGQARQPWLDVDALKQAFLTLSAPHHPDRVHSASDGERAAANQRFADLNAAYNLLREPRERLLHLLELELGSRPKDVQRLPPGTMDYFMEVGQLCREVDAFLAERARAASPMLRVKFLEQGMDWMDRIHALQQRIGQYRDLLLGEMQSLGPAWQQAPVVGAPERPAALPLERLENLYRTLSYTSRWAGQLQDRLTQLGP
jgi:curved DNA-binding protein CbpA